MPTLDDLHTADQQHAAAIASIKARLESHDDDLARHEDILTRHNEMLTELRTAYGKVATKDDIGGLREDITERFDRQLTAAHNSVPVKIALVFTGGMFLLALVTLVVNLAHGHV